MKRISILLISFLLGSSLLAQNSGIIPSQTDGPYVFREGKNRLKIVRVTESGISEELQKIKRPITVCSEDGQYRFEISVHDTKRPEWRYQEPEKILVLSDPHGDLEAFLSVLWAQEVIDKSFNWSFGRGHLMIIGDVFDRGSDVLPILWLIYKLEAEADRAGGAVHYLLGNHEEMVLRNNVRYTAKKYTDLAFYLDVEYRDLFAPGTVLGDWIMSRNTAEQIGSDLYVHGGLSREFLDQEWSIPELNRKISSFLYMSKPERDEIEEGKFLFGSNGPVWYRGMARSDEKYNPIKNKDVDAIRSFYGVNKVYVGHTTSSEVDTFYEGKVIGVNVDNKKNMNRGGSRGVLIEGDDRYVIYDDPAKREDIGSFNSVEISAKLEGICVGDTITTALYRIPYSKDDLGRDTLIVKKDGEFYFKTKIGHTSNISIRHSPASGSVKDSPISGLSIVVRRGDKIELNGSIDYIGSIRKSGGFYSNDMIAKLDSIECESNKERTDIYRKFNKLRLEKPADQDSVQYYLDKYQSYRNEEQRSLVNYIRDSVNNNEYAVALYLGSLYNRDADGIEARYNNLNEDIKTTHLGETLKRMESVFRNIEVGNYPKDFELIDTAGDTVKLSDYKGKYLLIYHWGLCPGTIWLHPKLLELYELYGEKNIAVLGITEDDIREVYLASGNDPRGLEVPTIKALTEHPWRNVYYSTPGNEYIVDELYLYVLPTIMLISPEGETLLRGYTDKYQDLKKFWEELPL